VNGENSSYCVAPLLSRHGAELGITLVGHEAPIEVALFNPHLFKVNVDGDIKFRSICALGSQDTGVSVWCTATGRALASVQKLFNNIVLDLTWSPCGYRYLII
jgi:protein HIRA/HIR1